MGLTMSPIGFPHGRQRLAARLRPLTLALVLALAACSGSDSNWLGWRMPGATPVSLSPEQTADTLLKTGDGERAAGDVAGAVGLYRHAHELAPGAVEPLQRLGETLAQIQSYTEASQAYEAALVIDAGNPDLHRGLGIVLLALGQPMLALSHLEIAARTRPNDPRVYNALGVAHDLSGHHDLAQQDYRKGLNLAPDQLSLRNNLGLSQALAGNYSGAAATLSDLAARPGATARNRQNLALVYGLAGDTDHAAAVGRSDLDEAAVRNNINYYTLLRSLDDIGRTAAILGADVRAARAAQSGSPSNENALAAASLPAPPIANAALGNFTARSTPVRRPPARAVPEPVLQVATLRASSAPAKIARVSALDTLAALTPAASRPIARNPAPRSAVGTTDRPARQRSDLIPPKPIALPPARSASTPSPALWPSVAVVQTAAAPQQGVQWPDARDAGAVEKEIPSAIMAALVHDALRIAPFANAGARGPMWPIEDLAAPALN